VTPFSCDFEIRYGEVDLQGVVFNAHYLAYVDHCVDRWLRSLAVLTVDGDWDIMVKKATIDWKGSAGLGETLTLVPRVSRWGTTSFDVTVEGAVGERPVFEAVVVYVGVTMGTKQPAPPPERVRAALSG
jgi:acyl-CoA thioester hydrolase